MEKEIKNGALDFDKEVGIRGPDISGLKVAKGAPLFPRIEEQKA
jgi:hypothetical protein